MLVGAIPEIIDKYLPEGVFRLEIQAFLVRTPNKNILIDAGVGRNLSGNLKALNISGDMIHAILLTHMHGDHIGGLLDGNTRRFPHAVILSSRLEYDYWLPQNSKPRTTQLEKIKTAYGNDFFRTFEFDEQVFANDIVKVTAIDAVGHTPGHTAYRLESKESRLLIIGDLLHAAALQFPLPEICSSYDMEPKATVASRKRILDFAVKENIPIGGMHLPPPNIGTVKSNGAGGYEFTPKRK
jgi:glyoxylase-like metal-dependent hydrolase (beta-lactamase superfamily II)